jgi:hypothetical protein
VAAFGLWAAARAGYAGAISWHRGYNVDVEPVTLVDSDYAAAANMLGYYEACADGCAPCETSCPTLDVSHDTWLQRQYATTRVLDGNDALQLDDRCLDSALELGDCAAAAAFQLDAGGHLRSGSGCLASSTGATIELVPCASVPEQYWVLDSEGSLWNGRPPDRIGDMAFDHVRCLAYAATATCGANLQAHWSYGSL